MSSTQHADSASAISGDNFVNVDSEELKWLNDLHFNQNTKRSTNTWINRFGTWKVSREVPCKLEEIPLSNFDERLQRFFTELKTCKSKDYEPDSLRTMLGALNCHLRDSGCTHRINDEQFLGAKMGRRLTCVRKAKRRKKKGRPNYRRARGANVGSKSTRI